MKSGDFTELAKHYINRPSYSKPLLQAILRIAGSDRKKDFSIVEVGAGTGKLTKMILELGYPVVAVEPNSEMREEGIKFTEAFKQVTWQEGTGEETGVESGVADWLVMASSFHWTDPNRSLPEFARVLVDDGYFTAVWNPRDLQSSELHMRIEDRIYAIAPQIKRVSSGAQNTKEWDKIIASSGYFRDVIFTEASHVEVMPKDRYMGAWESTNDIQSQAGPEAWVDILSAIRSEIDHLDEIEVPYKIRAWTACKSNRR